MESLVRARRAIGSALPLLVWLFSCQSAGALQEGGSAVVTEDGIREMIEREFANGVPGSPGSGSSASDCDWTVTPYPFTGTDPPAIYGEPPTPEHELYLVFCDGEFVSAEWLGPGRAVREVAGNLVARFMQDLPIGIDTIGARPEGKGVTGITSYFWVEGYSGAPITDSLSGAGVTVAVQVTLGSVTWDFGDGTPPTTGSLGEAWPARSSVHHTYRDRGDRAVTVTITMPAQFSVNGGAAQALPPVVRTATIPYRVDEIQAVRNR